MIDMANRPDVAMRLRPLKLRLRHLTAFSSKKTSQTKTNLHCDHLREPTGDAAGAGDGNRTHVASLEGWCSTIELHPPGAPPPAHNPPELHPTFRQTERHKAPGGGGRIRTYV